MIAIGKDPKDSADTLRTNGMIAAIVGLLLGGILLLLGLRRRPCAAGRAIGCPGVRRLPARRRADAGTAGAAPPMAPVAPAWPPAPPVAPPPAPPPGPANWPAPPSA